VVSECCALLLYKHTKTNMRFKMRPYETTWEAVSESIQKDDEGKWDNDVNVGTIEMRKGLIHIPGSKAPDGREDFFLTNYATQQMCTRFGIPHKYHAEVRDSNPSLADEMINQGITQYYTGATDTGQRSNRALIRGRGDTVRAILSQRYSPYDNHDIVSRVQEAVQSIGNNVRSCAFNDEAFFLKMTFDDLTIDDKSIPGGLLKSGMFIGNSEVGARSLIVSPFVFRLSCTNDMVLMKHQAFQQKHAFASKKDTDYQIERSVAYSMRKGYEMLHEVEKKQVELLDKPIEVLNFFSERAKLSKRQKMLVAQSFKDEPVESKFGIVNAFTRAARTERPEERVALEALAGSLLFEGDHSWDAAVKAVA